jgi:hypothetical protein
VPTAERTTEPAGTSGSSDEGLAILPAIRERHLAAAPGEPPKAHWLVRVSGIDALPGDRILLAPGAYKGDFVLGICVSAV